MVGPSGKAESVERGQSGGSPFVVENGRPGGLRNHQVRVLPPGDQVGQVLVAQFTKANPFPGQNHGERNYWVPTVRAPTPARACTSTPAAPSCQPFAVNDCPAAMPWWVCPS